jgi:hypothetical protein
MADERRQERGPETRRDGFSVLRLVLFSQFSPPTSRSLPLRTDTVISAHADGNDLSFEFLGGIHRVVETAGVGSPCSPNGGFDSGVVTVANGTLQGSGPSQSLALTNDTAVR